MATRTPGRCARMHTKQHHEGWTSTNEGTEPGTLRHYTEHLAGRGGTRPERTSTTSTRGSRTARGIEERAGETSTGESTDTARQECDTVEGDKRHKPVVSTSGKRKIEMRFQLANYANIGSVLEEQAMDEELQEELGVARARAGSENSAAGRPARLPHAGTEGEVEGDGLRARGLMALARTEEAAGSPGAATRVRRRRGKGGRDGGVEERVQAGE